MNLNHARVYAEVANASTVIAGSRVFQTRKTKPDVGSNATTARRLDNTAWTAIRAKLGL